ncbi:PREDICTED: monocarboxylate transporter 10 isoform X2 [Nicrophorus vespilloides]|uniref:Monocarboxylate transporter 10 isoform X2 n=1 Tax=Nicrophorus vespilloides TaxID=110193 RepID=A0ABM1MHX6_NICVS|nr:PREDICTED: monocarboxylate transporter 10 isoform X2 [Nicrophorus vespilloides]
MDVEVNESFLKTNGQKHQVTTNGNKAKERFEDDDQDVPPPDGGTRALLVMFGSFFCNGILFGVINTYSVLYNEIYENLNAQNVTDASSKAALVGSLAMGTTFMVSPVAGVLTDAIGIRVTTFLGGFIASGGMLLSSFCSDNVYALYVTYGVMYGLGCALAYTPSLAILGHYYKRYMGIVNGVVTAGSSVFTMALPHIIDGVLKGAGMVWTLRLLALLAAGIMGAATFFKPIQKKKKQTKIELKSIVNLDIFRNKRYLFWSIVLPLSLFGYFVPYVHMLKFVKENFSSGEDGKWPVICIGITSGIGRLVFGYISDLPKVNRILMQQASLLVIGGVSIALPSTKGSFPTLIFMTLLLGLFDGCFISMLGPIAFDLCGQKGATQAIGMLLGLCSIPLTLGPYIAGIMYDHTSSYDLAFRLAGIPPILGCCLLFFMRCLETPSPKHHQQNGKLPEKCQLDDNSSETLGNNSCSEDTAPV